MKYNWYNYVIFKNKNCFNFFNVLQYVIFISFGIFMIFIRINVEIVLRIDIVYLF